MASTPMTKAAQGLWLLLPSYLLFSCVWVCVTTMHKRMKRKNTQRLNNEQEKRPRGRLVGWVALGWGSWELVGRVSRGQGLEWVPIVLGWRGLRDSGMVEISGEGTARPRWGHGEGVPGLPLALVS